VHKHNDEILPGTLDMMILRSLGRGPRHGYDVAEYIHHSSEDILLVEEGALYQALHRLELRGFLDAEWGMSENNRRAKYYRLTALGRKHLSSEVARWARLSQAVSRVMGLA
jgi:transcriptional regulator